MGKKKKSAKIHKEALGKIIEIKAILRALSDIEQSSYPANMLLEMADKKLKTVFCNIEKAAKF